MDINHFEEIEKTRKRMGAKLCILAHHYQQDQVVQHADFIGDSLELARKIPNLEAKYIILCGVYFMAESAAILARKDQNVYIPEKKAGCDLSEMAPASLVEKKLDQLQEKGRKIIPLAYVNSSAAVKAICGKNNGSVCTSANAKIMMQWALSQGDAVLFLPDMNLGLNTGNQLGIPSQEISILDIESQSKDTGARLFIWPGYCYVHQRMSPEDINILRKKSPESKFVVHPECTPELVHLSDDSGSTSQIIKYIQNQSPGQTIYIGTETNMVNRLGRDHNSSLNIYPLKESFCQGMAQVTEKKLYQLLNNLNQLEPLTVDETIKKPALQALERMLKVCS